MRLVLATTREVDLQAAHQNLKVHTETDWVQSHIPLRCSQQHLSQHCVLETAPTVGTVSRACISRKGEKARSTTAGISSQVNQKSRPLYNLPWCLGRAISSHQCKFCGEQRSGGGRKPGGSREDEREARRGRKKKKEDSPNTPQRKPISTWSPSSETHFLGTDQNKGRCVREERGILGWSGSPGFKWGQKAGGRATPYDTLHSHHCVLRALCSLSWWPQSIRQSINKKRQSPALLYPTVLTGAKTFGINQKTSEQFSTHSVFREQCHIPEKIYRDTYTQVNPIITTDMTEHWGCFCCYLILGPVTSNFSNCAIFG